MIVRWDSPERLLSVDSAAGSQNPLDSLSRAEQQRLATVSHERTRDQMAAARVLLRKTLAEHVKGTAPHTWVVERNSEGAPFVSHPGVAVPPEVSMTHTDGLVAVALDRSRCGVDVEAWARPISSRRLARRFFPSHEFDALSKLPDAELHREFILRWTVREAWTKAERSTFLDALKRCETARTTSGSLDLLVDAQSHVTTGRLFSEIVEGFVITALSLSTECEALPHLGHVHVRQSSPNTGQTDRR